MKRNLIYSSTAVLIPLIVAGCSYNVALTSEAEKINVLQSTKMAMKCKALGNLWAYDTNGSTQSYQSHEHLYTDELNILKNKAALLGADSLVITKHHVTYQGNPKHDNVDEHQLKGTAYRCNR